MKSRELLSAGRPEDNSKTQSIDLQCCLTGRSRLRQIQAKIPNLRVDVSSFHRFDDAYCDIPGCAHDFSTKEPEFLNGEARRLHSRQPCVSLACMPDGASIGPLPCLPFSQFQAPHAERNHFGSAWPLPSQSHSDSARSPHQTMLGCSVVCPVPLPGFRRQLRQATLCEDQETPHPSPRKVTTASPPPSEAALWHSTAPHHQSHSVTSPWTRSPSKKKPALCPLRGVCARI